MDKWKRCLTLFMLMVLATVTMCCAQTTETVCEHESLKISCPGGDVLKIHDALYGRMNTTICPGQNSENTSPCQAEGSLSIVRAMCENETSCTVQAENTVFTDPCKGTFKYLQVEYSCVRLCGDKYCNTTTQECLKDGNGAATCSCIEENHELADEDCREIPPPPCPGETIYVSGIKLTFPAAQTGVTVESEENCPEGYSNNNSLATRYCGESWEDPVSTQCYDEEMLEAQLEELAQTNVTEDNVQEVAGMLVLASSQPDDISPDGLENIIITLDSVVAVEDSSEEVTDSVVGVTNNVMALDDTMLSETPDVNQIVPLLETQIRLVHELGGNYTEVLPNIGTSALQLERASFEEPVLYEDPFMEGSVLDEDNASAVWSTISLPTSVLSVIDTVVPNITSVPVSFITYLNAGLFQPNDATSHGDQNTPFESYEYVEGHVIAATIEIDNVTIADLPTNSSITTRFSKPMTAKEGETANHTTEFLCVYWDYNESDGYGKWSQDGCQRIPCEGDEIVCSCDHLTSFAVLIRVTGESQGGEKYQLALDIITVIGCVFSVIGLSFCIVAMLIIRSVRQKQQTHVHFNLCLSLLGLYMSFLLGIDQADQPGLCRAMTSLIYFFCLSSVSWMAVEGYYIYSLIWKCKQSSVRHLILFAVLLAWGLPAIAAILVAFLDNSHDYVAEADYCFLHPGPVLYFGFLLEVLLLFSYNFLVFILVTYRVNSRKITFSNKDDKKREMVTRIKSTFLFWVILGMAWFFGFLATFHSPLILAFEVLFCICLSLQGFFMFYMLFVQNPEMKKGIKSVASRHSSNSTGEVARTTHQRNVSSQEPKESVFDHQTYDMQPNPVVDNLYYEVKG